MFSNSSQLMEKKFMANCNHHWTVHIKSEFQHLAGGGL